MNCGAATGFLPNFVGFPYLRGLHSSTVQPPLCAGAAGACAGARLRLPEAVPGGRATRVRGPPRCGSIRLGPPRRKCGDRAAHPPYGPHGPRRTDAALELGCPVSAASAAASASAAPAGRATAAGVAAAGRAAATAGRRGGSPVGRSGRSRTAVTRARQPPGDPPTAVAATAVVAAGAAAARRPPRPAAAAGRRHHVPPTSSAGGQGRPDKDEDDNRQDDADDHGFTLPPVPPKRPPVGASLGACGGDAPPAHRPKQS
jgi:hypothetical protein